MNRSANRIDEILVALNRRFTLRSIFVARYTGVWTFGFDSDHPLPIARYDYSRIFPLRLYHGVCTILARFI